MKKTILLVDDDEEMCEEISEALRGEGYDVSVSHDGREGLKLILDNNYDLVLLDVRLPGMSGIDVLKNVRESKQGVYIVVVTGMPMSGELLKSETGTLSRRDELLKLADGVLSKPFEMNALLKTVSDAMERR